MEGIKEKIEYKIIDEINTGADGRLVVFRPEKNKFGADLVVEKRGEYENNKKIFLKIIQLDKENTLPEKDFTAQADFYLVFLHFDMVAQKIEDSIWLIPSLQFESLDPNFLMNINMLGDFLFDAFGKAHKTDHSKDFLKKHII